MPSNLPSTPASPTRSHENSSHLYPNSGHEQTPPASDTSLSDQLDALLVNYLTLLDQYTTLRAELSKELSSGFFALAQANRNANSSLGAGRRYGEEGFDDRMKARRVVKIELKDKEEAGDRRRIPAEEKQHGVRHDATQADEPERNTEPVGEQEQEVEAAQSDKQKRQDQQKGEPIPDETIDRVNPEFSPFMTSPPAYIYSVLSAASSATPATTKDPLNWYGILVPPALRTCQTAFTHAIASDLPDLINIEAAMSYVEDEIWTIRRKMGVLGDYASQQQRKEQHAPQEVEIAAKRAVTEGHGESDVSLSGLSLSPTASRTTPSKKVNRLPSTAPSPSTSLRPEPRPRVLKLD